MKKYEVWGSFDVTCVAYVEAESKEEAEQKAYELNPSKWEFAVSRPDGPVEVGDVMEVINDEDQVA